MKSIVVILIFFCSVGAAQEIRYERQNPPTMYDGKKNNDSIPDSYLFKGEFERIVVIRLKYQTDLLAGLEKGIKENNITNAVILSGIGSVTSYHYHVVSNTEFPSKNLFVKNSGSPADLVSMNGYVISGRVHAHAAFANPEKVFGGHLEPGTNVFTFAIITVGVLSDTTDLGRIDDKNFR